MLSGRRYNVPCGTRGQAKRGMRMPDPRFCTFLKVNLRDSFLSRRYLCSIIVSYEAKLQILILMRYLYILKEKLFENVE